jgi:hypothetical protein
MRKRQTFLLTIITSETGEPSLCGRLKVISSGQELNFSCEEELFKLINSEMHQETLKNLSGSNLQYPLAPDALVS